MTADANKAESLICMDRARDALRIGDHAKAERMLNKAKKLDPNQDISFLLKKARSLAGMKQSSSESSNDRSYAHDDHYEEPNLRSRKPNRSPPRKHSSPIRTSPPPRPNPNPHRSKSAERTQLGVHYTKEEQQLVERIRHCKDYYEILNLKKDASEAQIKKEYRKLALQLHPDKCRAPHATEAFKALGNAYAVLSDKSKRSQYDAHGTTDMSSRRSHGDYFEYDYGRGFEADITPEEIFNMFFGGGHPSEHRRHFQHQFHAHREDSTYSGMVQLLPILLMVILGLVTQFMVGDPAFSLQQSSKFSVRRETSDLRVPFFVKKDFEQTYRDRIHQVEQQVEDEYINQLRMHCYKEQNHKESVKYRARLYGDMDTLRRAESMAMPNCNRLQEIYNK